MSPDITVDIEIGSVHVIPIVATSTDVTLLTSDGYLCGWSVRDASGDVATDTEGTVTTPGAGAAIATSPALGGGTYTVKWTVSLAGTPGAGDANNFGLFVGATQVATSVNLGAGGEYPQPDTQVTVPQGTAVSVKAIGAGTAGAIYTAVVSNNLDTVADTLVEIQDIGNAIGEISINASQAHTQWFGPQGLKMRGQVKLHVIQGAITGAVYCRYARY